jgi:hypothetical protein
MIARSTWLRIAVLAAFAISSGVVLVHSAFEEDGNDHADCAVCAVTGPALAATHDQPVPAELVFVEYIGVAASDADDASFVLTSRSRDPPAA